MKELQLENPPTSRAMKICQVQDDEFHRNNPTTWNHLIMSPVVRETLQWLYMYPVSACTDPWFSFIPKQAHNMAIIHEYPCWLVKSFKVHFPQSRQLWPLSPTPVPLSTKLTSVLCHCHWIQLYSVWFLCIDFGESLVHMNKDTLFLAYGSFVLSSQSDAASLLDFSSVYHSFMQALVPLAAAMSHPSHIPPSSDNWSDRSILL